MSKPAFDKKYQIRSTRRAKLGLDRAVAALRADDRVRWFGGIVSQEAVVSASWLLLEEMGHEALRDAIARHLPRLEAILRGEPDPGARVTYALDRNGSPGAADGEKGRRRKA